MPDYHRSVDQLPDLTHRFFYSHFNGAVCIA
jgi:hypothetical protein